MSKALSAVNWIYRGFAYLGENIIKCPNKAFYVLIVFLCIFAPLFALIVVLALLCGIYRRHVH